MNISVAHDKHAYDSLLLLADESPAMIARYLDRGTMYVLDDDGVKAEVVVCDEGGGVLEIKNLAVLPHWQRRGYGRALVAFVCTRYAGAYRVLTVGTGDSPLTVPFYERCGFRRSHRVKDFFTKNYDHPIYEGGVLLTDMVYLTKDL